MTQPPGGDPTDQDRHAYFHCLALARRYGRGKFLVDVRGPGAALMVNGKDRRPLRPVVGEVPSELGAGCLLPLFFRATFSPSGKSNT